MSTVVSPANFAAVQSIYRSTRYHITRDESREFFKAMKKSEAFIIYHKSAYDYCATYTFTERTPEEGLLKIKVVIGEQDVIGEQEIDPNTRERMVYYHRSYIEVSYIDDKGNLVDSLDKCFESIGKRAKDFLIYHLDMFESRG